MPPATSWALFGEVPVNQTGTGLQGQAFPRVKPLRDKALPRRARHETLCLQGFAAVLADGTYDAIVVDAARVEDENDATRAHIAIDLAITRGAAARRSCADGCA